MELLTILLFAWCACAVWMLLLWAIQQIKKEADIVDFGWALSLGGLSIWYAYSASGGLLGRIVCSLFVTIWALRLGLHLLVDRVLKKGEDQRYKALREYWGIKATRNFFYFFQAQALLALLLSMPFLIIMSDTPSLLQILLATVVFSVSLYAEHCADQQLKVFRSNPENKGKICKEGLWKYSRHPNYFFEWVYWWTFVILAWPLPYGYFSLISPALMLYFLLRVTGIPATEAQALQSKGEQYKEYQRTTSAFIPWFPK